MSTRNLAGRARINETLLSVLAILQPTALCAASAQIHQRMSGEAAPGLLQLEVVDRYRVPVHGASVSVVHRYFGSTSFPTLDASSSTIQEQWTEVDGRAEFSTDPEGLCWALVERTGYAPLIAYPLFPGHRYELELDLGTSISVWCKTEAGAPAVGAKVELFWRPCATLPGRNIWPIATSQPLVTRDADAFGLVQLEHLPRGQFEIRASATEGAVARANFQIASAFGNEQAPGSDIHLSLRRHPPYKFTVISDHGEPLAEAVAWIGRKTLPLVDADESVQARQGTIVLSGVDPEDIVQFHFAAPGHDVESVAALDPMTGKLSAALPTTIRLAAQPLRSVEFDTLSISGARELDFFTPELLGTTGSTGRWLQIPTTGDSSRVDRLPLSVDVFAIALSKRRVVGFMSVDDAGEVRFIKAGTLEVTYKVGQSAPEGAYIRAYRVQPDSGSESPAPGISIHRIEICNPDGKVRFEGLLPGRYRLEPHFHYSVFGDALTELAVDEGSTVSHQVLVRRGNLVRVRVESQSKEPVLAGLIEIRSTEVPVYRMDSAVELDRSGAALIGGLDPEATYTLHYRPMNSAVSLAKGSRTIVPPHPGDLTITLDGNWR